MISAAANSSFWIALEIIALCSTATFSAAAADPLFTPQRGFFDHSIDVSIRSDVAGAKILFTTNGFPATQEFGKSYIEPLQITGSTIVRAAVYDGGHLVGEPQTQSYIFMKDVLKQTGDAFPKQWGTNNGKAVIADYEMDPNVVNAAAYRDTIRDDIVGKIPTLSIVMSQADLFGPGGIYSNTEGRGDAWERPCSMELIYPDPALSPTGQGGFHVNCGIRIYGYGWRSHHLATVI